MIVSENKWTHVYICGYVILSFFQFVIPASGFRCYYYFLFIFNDALNTFYLRLYGVGHMVKYHSDSERKPAAATWATLSD